VKKKVFAYLLLTIISFQLLPLKEVGAVFYGNQMIEELCHGATDSDGKSAESNEELKKSDIYFHHFTVSLLLHTNSTANLHATQQDYQSRLADDIITPPPIFTA
jgi:hypothetical protein